MHRSEIQTKHTDCKKEDSLSDVVEEERRRATGEDYDARIVSCGSVEDIFFRSEEGRMLKEGSTLSFVGFCGRAVASVSKEVEEEVFSVDGELVRGLVEIPGMVFYTTMKRIDGDLDQWINLVAFIGDAAKTQWHNFTLHSKLVRRFSHQFYSHIRLHNGEWILPDKLPRCMPMQIPGLRLPKYFDQLVGDITLTSTKYLYFDKHERMSESEWQNYKQQCQLSEREDSGRAVTSWRSYRKYGSGQ